jgi:hypothetical protein
MSSTIFTPLTKEIDIVPSTTDAAGAPLPAGEMLSSVTLGIRPDGSPAVDPVTGTYPMTVIVQAPATVESKAALLAALTSLGTGNYWLAGLQSDALGTQTFKSNWGKEVPFSIPPVGVAPAPPAVSVV